MWNGQKEAENTIPIETEVPISVLSIVKGTYFPLFYSLSPLFHLIPTFSIKHITEKVGMFHNLVAKLHSFVYQFYPYFAQNFIHLLVCLSTSSILNIPIILEIKL